jgi:hypothetical protein
MPTLEAEPMPTLETEPMPTLEAETLSTLEAEPMPTLEAETMPTLEAESSKVMSQGRHLVLLFILCPGLHACRWVECKAELSPVSNEGQPPHQHQLVYPTSFLIYAPVLLINTCPSN